ncbi:MAG: hypothetical protein IKG87_02620 [Clostridia bacterium]|nr:hypothetical protein [Clostridia bacterium]
MKKLIAIICIIVLSISIISSGSIAETMPTGFARLDMSPEEYGTWAASAFGKVSEWEEGSRNLDHFPLQMESVKRLFDEFKSNTSILDKDETYVYWRSEALKVVFDERLIGATIYVEFGSEEKKMEVNVQSDADWYNGVLCFQLSDGYTFEEISALKIDYQSFGWIDGYLGYIIFCLTYDVSDGRIVSKELRTEMDDGRYIISWNLSDKYNEDKNLYLSGMFYDLAFDIEFSETFDPITGMNIEY